MYTYFKFFILAASVLLWGCGSSSQKTEKTNNSRVEKPAKTDHIDLPEKGEDILAVSSFADTVLYIPLETTPQSLIRKIFQIQLIGDKILLDCNDKLLLYSQSGKFIRQIGQKGNGPGEYNYVCNSVARGDTIYISPTNKQTIIKYLLNGDFVGEKLLPGHFRMSWFDMTPDGEFVSYADLARGKLDVLDKNLSKINQLIINHNAPVSTPPTIYRNMYDYSLQNGSERRLLFTDYMSDTIWDISKGRKKVGYVLNMGDKILPEKYRFERFGFDHKAWMKAAAPYQKIKMVETPDYLFLFQKGWTTEKILNTIYIYNRADNTIKRYDTPYIYDDLVGKRNLNVLYSSHDCLMAVVNPFELKPELEKEQVEGQTGKDAPSPAWLKQMSKVKEDDNPILVIIHPKVN
ncbi:hypothetical protein PbJCM13498_39650 [Prolixibacter bellariivorans]|uniref:6-bladed beta-propeller n=1 Tax=Prolixibacter bellariivorans TaxID=314319 RepID=A0A5M4B4M0_9BACT|nr:6-bladed beta-propeller [Prolixibacter bellariivorans]GET35102.1 hypothetical protein PbJCM13498_39650 [Prolixibacter bellariivorans]